MNNSKFNKKELKEKFKSIKKAFKTFNSIELTGRKHIQNAILGCYDVYLHYNEKLIEERCEKAGIKYLHKKPMKMILMLGMKVSDECDDERIKARIRTYVRVLKKIAECGYDVEEAKEELNKFGIDYFANPRSKNQNDTEDLDEEYDDENQLELPFGDDDEDTEEGDDEEEEINEADDDDNNNADAQTSTSESQKQSLGDKTVKFFQANNIKDKNYVIWVVGNEVYKSIDTALLKRLDDFDFIKLK